MSARDKHGLEDRRRAAAADRAGGHMPTGRSRSGDDDRRRRRPVAPVGRRRGQRPPGDRHQEDGDAADGAVQAVGSVLEPGHHHSRGQGRQPVPGHHQRAELAMAVHQAEHRMAGEAGRPAAATVRRTWAHPARLAGPPTRRPTTQGPPRPARWWTESTPRPLHGPARPAPPRRQPRPLAGSRRASSHAVPAGPLRPLPVDVGDPPPRPGRRRRHGSAAGRARAEQGEAAGVEPEVEGGADAVGQWGQQGCGYLDHGAAALAD